MFTDTWDSQGAMYTEPGRLFMFHVLQWNLKSRLEIKKTAQIHFQTQTDKSAMYCSIPPW